MNKETIEGNKRIAVFHGWTLKEPDLTRAYKGEFLMHQSGQYVVNDVDLKYHSSWDWLMPVVEKIAVIPSISITIESFTVEHGDKMVGVCEIKRTFWPRHSVVETEPIAYRKEFTDKLPLIQNVLERVIQFIQWYNSQSKTKP